MCIGLYFDDGLGVSIGRWSFYVINKLFHVTGFEPFIMEFAAVLILMFAAIVWSAVLRYILGDKLPIACYAVFSAMFLDYSLIAEDLFIICRMEYQLFIHLLEWRFLISTICIHMIWSKNSGFCINWE